MDSVESSRARIDAILYDFYGDKADGPLVTADSGQTWVLNANNTDPDTVPRIVDGTVRNVLAGASVGKSYWQADLGEQVTRAGGKFKFVGAHTLETSLAAILIMDRPLLRAIAPAAGSFPNMAAHVTINQRKWTFEYWDYTGPDGVGTDGVQNVPIMNADFDVPLADGEELELEVFIDYESSTATIRTDRACTSVTAQLNNATARTSTDKMVHAITDPGITGHADMTWVSFETTQEPQPATAKPAWTAVWSDVESAAQERARPTKGSVLLDVMRIVAAPGGPTLAPTVASYAPTIPANMLLTADNTWRSWDPVNLAVTLDHPESARILVQFEAYLIASVAGRVFWAVSDGRAQIGVGTTSGSAVITGPSGAFSEDDEGKRISGKGRTIASVVTTNAAPGITAPASTFTVDDTGRKISGAGIPAGTTLLYVSGTQATLRNAAGSADVNATASATINAYVDTGIAATHPTYPTIASVESDTSATLSAPATANGTGLVVTIDNPAEYGAQDIVNEVVTSRKMRAMALISALVAGTPKTLIWRARQTAGSPVLMHADGPLARTALLTAEPAK